MGVGLRLALFHLVGGVSPHRRSDTPDGVGNLPLRCADALAVGVGIATHQELTRAVRYGCKERCEVDAASHIVRVGGADKLVVPVFPCDAGAGVGVGDATHDEIAGTAGGIYLVSLVAVGDGLRSELRAVGDAGRHTVGQSLEIDGGVLDVCTRVIHEQQAVILVGGSEGAEGQFWHGEIPASTHGHRTASVTLQAQLVLSRGEQACTLKVGDRHNALHYAAIIAVDRIVASGGANHGIEIVLHRHVLVLPRFQIASEGRNYDAILQVLLKRVGCCCCCVGGFRCCCAGGVVALRTGMVVTSLSVVTLRTGMVLPCLGVVTCRCGMVTFRTGVVITCLNVVGIGTLHECGHLSVVTHGGLVVGLSAGVVLFGLLVVGYGHGMILGEDSLAVVLVQLSLRLSGHATCLLIHTLLLLGDALLFSTNATLLLTDTLVFLSHAVLLRTDTGSLIVNALVLVVDAGVLRIYPRLFGRDSALLSSHALQLILGHSVVTLHHLVVECFNARHVDNLKPPLLIGQRVS